MHIFVVPSKPMPTMSSGTINIPNESLAKTTTTRGHLPPRKPITLSVPRNGAIHMTKTSSGAQWAGERPKPDMLLGRGGQNTNILAQLQASVVASKQTQSSATNASNATTNPLTPNEFDIALLREKSKHLDLPLISALCNDRSLLKQTKVLVNPRNPKPGTTTSNSSASPTLSTTSSSLTENTPTLNIMQLASLNSNNNGSPTATSTLTSTTTITATTAATATSTSKTLASSVTAKSRKSATSHRHPNDKLPPLPMQLAEANNYVLDPAILKHHKSYNSHT